MNHVAITIATRNRYDKLINCLDSIPDVDYISVIVCCDGDIESMAVSSHPVVKTLLYTKNNIGSPACHNLMVPYVTDGLLYLMDDMELQPDTIDIALREYNLHFPDNDGMMGLHQVNFSEENKSGVALLGRNFLARFPHRQFNYPGYWHFSDMETLALAEKIGKYHYCRDAHVIHHHPDFGGKKDGTHEDARRYREQDFSLFKVRQAQGLIWGLTDFEIVFFDNSWEI